jgi:cation transport ATPase
VTVPGRIAYFVVLLFLAVLGFSVRLDLWLSMCVAMVAMAGVSLFEVGLSRRRERVR